MSPAGRATYNRLTETSRLCSRLPDPCQTELLLTASVSHHAVDARHCGIAPLYRALNRAHLLAGRKENQKSSSKCASKGMDLCYHGSCASRRQSATRVEDVPTSGPGARRIWRAWVRSAVAAGRRSPAPG